MKNNPFKMIGSWIGLILGAILLFFTKSWLYIAHFLGHYNCMAGAEFGSINCACIAEESYICGEQSLLTAPAVFLLGGFLLGYLIHIYGRKKRWWR